MHAYVSTYLKQKRCAERSSSHLGLRRCAGNRECESSPWTLYEPRREPEAPGEPTEDAGNGWSNPVPRSLKTPRVREREHLTILSHVELLNSSPLSLRIRSLGRATQIHRTLLKSFRLWCRSCRIASDSARTLLSLNHSCTMLYCMVSCCESGFSKDSQARCQVS